MNPKQSLTLNVDFKGKKIKRVTNAKVVTASRFNSVNKFDDPEIIRPTEFKKYKIMNDHTVQIEMPSKSVVALELE